MARLASFKDALKQDPYEDAQAPEEPVGEGSGTAILEEPEPQEQRSAATSAPQQRRSRPVVEPPAVPLYLQLQRKEARLRQEQVDDLEMLTKQINRRRSGTPEQRITDNTMIRIAIDLLLERRGELDGNSENELRESLGLPEVEY